MFPVFQIAAKVGFKWKAGNKVILPEQKSYF